MKIRIILAALVMIIMFGLAIAFTRIDTDACECFYNLITLSGILLNIEDNTIKVSLCVQFIYLHNLI